MVRKHGPPEHLCAGYEAGPTGFVLRWQLSELGVKCEVVVPTLVASGQPPWLDAVMSSSRVARFRAKPRRASANKNGHQAVNRGLSSFLPQAYRLAKGVAAGLTAVPR